MCHWHVFAQGREIWQAHGEWVTKHQPDFGPGIRDRFDMASRITDQEAADASTKRAKCA
jgi:amidase